MIRITQGSLLWVCLLLACQSPVPQTFFPADDLHYRYNGRFWANSDSSRQFAWSGSEISVDFTGSKCLLHINTIPLPGARPAYPPEVWFRAQFDDQEEILFQTFPGKQDYLLALTLSPGRHHLSLFRRTEAETGLSTFMGLTLFPGAKLLPATAPPKRKMVFYGNSITCGYGNEGANRDCNFTPATENAWKSYAALTARALKADFRTISFSGRGVFQNYSKTRTGTIPQLYDRYFPGHEGPAWDFAQIPADWVVVNLGTNDFAHGPPDISAFQTTYLDFVRKLRTAYPNANILLLTGPMMSGPPLAQLRDHLNTLQKSLQDNKLFRLDLSTQGALGYGCDWHPNLAQHQVNAKELTAFIRAHSDW